MAEPKPACFWCVTSSLAVRDLDLWEGLSGRSAEPGVSSHCSEVPGAERVVLMERCELQIAVTGAGAGGPEAYSQLWRAEPSWFVLGSVCRVTALPSWSRGEERFLRDMGRSPAPADERKAPKLSFSSLSLGPP